MLQTQTSTESAKTDDERILTRETRSLGLSVEVLHHPVSLFLKRRTNPWIIFNSKFDETMHFSFHDIFSSFEIIKRDSMEVRIYPGSITLSSLLQLRITVRTDFQPTRRFFEEASHYRIVAIRKTRSWWIFRRTFLKAISRKRQS